MTKKTNAVMEQIDLKKQYSQVNQSLISTNHLFVIIEEK